MPAIETVSALTANEAWICVSTTTMSGSHDVDVAAPTLPSPVVVAAPLAPVVESLADAHACPPVGTSMHCRIRTISLYCGARSWGHGREARAHEITPGCGIRH